MDLAHYSPKETFSQRHLLGLKDYTKDEILQILKTALALKAKKKTGVPHRLLPGRTLGMIFTKSSTRTRVSFETGIYQLGGIGLFLSANDIQLRRGETIADTAKTLSRMVDGIMIRTYNQQDADDLAKYGTVPVINGLTDLLHPCQALADLMTFYEHKGAFSGKKLAYIGDGNNVAHSLLTICSKLGVNIAVGCPKGFEPDPQITRHAEKQAAKTGSSVEITQNPVKAVKNADAVYTDVWTSMGQEENADEKYAHLKAYQVNTALFKQAQPGAVFMHCLPAHRGEEVTADIIDGSMSVVFDQAENRLHVQKAVMALLMK